MANHISIGIFLILYAAWHVNGQEVNCTQTGVGRFANPDDTTCKNYTYCVYDRASNTYIGYNYVCPTTSVFNPITRLCTAPTNYVCIITTTVPTTIATTTVAADVCTTDGFVADPSSTDCSSYIQCVQFNETFDEETLICPNGTYYNPSTTYCESDYVCTSATTITTESTTTVTATFSCTTVGRFANPDDTTCKTYTYCVYDRASNTYIGYNYVCPTTSVFNPNTRLCTAPTNYVCRITTTVPTTIATTTVAADVCTTDGFVADPSSSDCSSYIQCVQFNETFDEETLICPNGTYYNPSTTYCESDYVCTSATTITTESTTTVAATFSCTTVGRFANSADTTCQTYYFCVASSTGTFANYLFTCPTTSVFSPTLRVCTTRYVCPTS